MKAFLITYCADTLNKLWFHPFPVLTMYRHSHLSEKGANYILEIFSSGLSLLQDTFKAKGLQAFKTHWKKTFKSYTGVRSV